MWQMKNTIKFENVRAGVQYVGREEIIRFPR